MKIFDFYNKKSSSNLDWQKQLIINYLTMQVCLALEGIGFFELLNNRKKLNIKEASVLLGTDVNLLSACIEFLSSVTDLLEREGEFFRLKFPDISKALWGSKAYQPVINELENLLKGKKIYSKDLTRDTYYLQKSSDRFSFNTMVRILSLLNDEPLANLIDFGCGSARNSIVYCSQYPTRRSMGIDIDPIIIEQAKSNISRAGLTNAITIIEADIFDISKWRKYLSNSQQNLFLASGVLHEFLRHKKDYLLEFLKNLHLNFPGSRFFISEVAALSKEEIKLEPDLWKRFYSAMYKLWHEFSDQGLPQKSEFWIEVINSSGCKLNNIILSDIDRNIIIYDCEL